MHKGGVTGYTDTCLQSMQASNEVLRIYLYSKYADMDGGAPFSLNRAQTQVSQYEQAEGRAYSGPYQPRLYL